MKYLLLILSFIPAFVFGQSNYYVAASGTDAGSCPIGSPCKTIAYINTLSIAAGSSILFNGGDFFNGKLNIPANNITVMSYGTGKATLTGLTTLSTWTSLGSNVYEAQCLNCKATDGVVLVDGAQYHKGRFPNSTWNIYQSHVGSTSISDTTLTGTPNYTGDQLVVRLVNYVTDVVPITAQSGNTLTYTCSSCFGATNGLGYFIENLPPDTVGEYYFNPTTDSLQIYIVGGPTGHTIQTTTVDTVINANAKTGIVVQNLNITGANVFGYSNNGSNNTIKNCLFNFMGNDGIGGPGSTGLKVLNDTFYNSNTNGMDMGGSSVSDTILNCLIKNSGTIDGMNASGEPRMCGIVAVGNFNCLKFNEIDTSGYCGVFTGGDSISVDSNTINYYCYKKDDGGGIYMNTGVTPVVNKLRRLIGNLCINGMGAPNGKISSIILIALGIYTDENSSELLITGNSLVNNYTAGWNCGGDHNVTFDHNIIFHNLSSTRTAGIQILSGTASPVRNVTITNNVVSVPIGTKVFYCETYTGDTITKWGNINNNYYASTGGIYQVYLNPTFTNYTYIQWGTLTSTDLNSTLTATADRYLINLNPATSFFPLGAIYKDSYGSSYRGGISLTMAKAAALFYFGPLSIPIGVGSRIILH